MLGVIWSKIMKKLKTLAVIGVVLLAVSLLVWQARAAEDESLTLCFRRNGLVFAVGDGFRRADCRHNERLVTLNLGGGLPGPEGPVGDKGPTGDQGPIG